MTVSIEISRIAGQAKKKNLSEKPLWGTIKNQESIVFDKMRTNENRGFNLTDYAKIGVKMTYFIASVPSRDSKL